MFPSTLVSCVAYLTDWYSCIPISGHFELYFLSSSLTGLQKVERKNNTWMTKHTFGCPFFWKTTSYDKFGTMIIYIGTILQPKCSRCSEGGHYTVSCPKKSSDTPRNCDDSKVNSLLILSGEKEPEDQKTFVSKVHRSWALWGTCNIYIIQGVSH